MFNTKMRQLVCNDDGVPFIEAFWDEELACVVKCEDFQPVRTLAGYDLLCLDFNAYSQAAADEYPALFVQIMLCAIAEVRSKRKVHDEDSSCHAGLQALEAYFSPCSRLCCIPA